MFPKRIKIGKRWIGEGCPTFFIAEIGANFDGSLKKAKELAEAAKESGADCAKFQTFSSKAIVAPEGFARMKLKGVHGSWKKPVHEVFKAAEFPRSWHRELMNYCKKIGVIFSSAPYDFEAVDLLDSLKVDFIKIGSGDITWHEMLRYIAKKRRPIFMGTGASTLAEVDEAVRTIAATGNRNLVVMQCITNYPSSFESANIRVLETYRNAFDVLVGYSDHTPEDVVPFGAVSLGACVVEKHFTLDRRAKGPDHPHSMEPQEFAAMVRKTRQLEQALGSSVKNVVAEESETVIVQRRSLYLARTVEAGRKITRADIVELRPALGILPRFKDHIVGMRPRKRLEAGTPLYWKDLGA